MKFLLLMLLFLLCGCTPQPYAVMSETPTTLEEDLGLTRRAVREVSHMAEGITSYSLRLVSDSRDPLRFERWYLQRFCDGQWYDMRDCGGELDLILESYEDTGVSTVPLTLYFLPLSSGYYRIAITVESVEGVLCSEFAVGSLTKLSAADLPASEYELDSDVNVQVVVPQQVGVGATDVLYYLDVGGAYTGGCFSALEREIDGQWCELPAPESSYELVATGYDPGNCYYERFCLYYHLFPLEPGHYRIIEEVRRDLRGEALYIAGEFDVQDVSDEDLAVRIPEGLTMEVTEIGTPQREPWEKGWVSDCWVELTITNASEQTAFLRSSELTRYELQESEAAQHGHDHVYALAAGESRRQQVRLAIMKPTRGMDYTPVVDENGPYQLGGEIEDGIYHATRRVTFEDGTWSILDCAFEVRDGALVK